jgi:hypothetical protein
MKGEPTKGFGDLSAQLKAGLALLPVLTLALSFLASYTGKKVAESEQQNRIASLEKIAERNSAAVAKIPLLEVEIQNLKAAQGQCLTKGEAAIFMRGTQESVSDIRSDIRKMLGGVK